MKFSISRHDIFDMVIVPRRRIFDISTMVND